MYYIVYIYIYIFFSFTHLAYASLINQKKNKSPHVQVKKIQSVDTGITNINCIYIQLNKLKKTLLYVYTKVIYYEVYTFIPSEAFSATSR